MKLLCVIDSLNAGGAQRQLVEIGVGLKGRGHEVEFFTYHAQGHFKPDLERAGIPVHLHAKGTRFSVGPIVALKRLVEQGGYEAVLAFLETPAFYAELAGVGRRSWKLVVGERCADPGILNGVRKILRWPHRFADLVVTNSHANRQMLEESWPRLKPKLSTIYNSVDLERFRPPDDGQPGLTGEALRMVVAASYLPRKNMLGLAQGLRLFHEDGGKDLVVNWFGAMPADTGAYHEALRFIDEHNLQDSLRLHPATPDIESEYRRANVVGLFSTFEGLPNVICEAMACGKPVIMSDVCDARNLVSDGTTGFLCDPDDPKSIAKALHRFVGLSLDERSAMGSRARTVAEDLFSREALLNAYEEVLGPGSNGVKSS